MERRLTTDWALFPKLINHTSIAPLEKSQNSQEIPFFYLCDTMATRSKRILSAQSQCELPTKHKRRKHYTVIDDTVASPNQKTYSKHGLSRRGWSNVEAIMPNIKGALEQRSMPKNPNIDLSTAENWLIRPELIQICKTAISTDLQAIVSYNPTPDIKK